jgi:putative ABC transport system permease protein
VSSTFVELSYRDVSLSTILILINGVLSFVLQLRLERSLLLAGGRAVVQLLLVGVLLDWVLRNPQFGIVFTLSVIMTVAASFTAVRRSSRRMPGVYLNSLISVAVSSWAMMAVLLTGIFRHLQPWFDPRYIVPFMGMLLGNTLTGVSLGFDSLAKELSGKRDQVEALLTLGATRWEAARPFVQRALRTGMTPTINAMAAAGIVNVPGVMTGQILAGSPPVQAARYQIVILFLIASGTALGTVGIVLLSYRRLFTTYHQFLHTAIRTQTTRGMLGKSDVKG